MRNFSNVFIPDAAQAESFEFIMGLAEQRCMVLHPGSCHAGFVDEDASSRESDMSRSRPSSPEPADKGLL